MAEFFAYIVTLGPVGFLAYWLLLMKWSWQNWRNRRTAYTQIAIFLVISAVLLLPSFSDETRFLQDREELRVVATMIGAIIGFLTHLAFTKKKASV